jgi:hypothetical protein
MPDRPESRVRTLRTQRYVNLAVRGLLRTPLLSRLAGRRLVVLHVIGRTSHRRYTIPVAYLKDGDALLIGTSAPWSRNLRTGTPITVRLAGRLREASVHVATSEPDVVDAYTHMVRANPVFARFNAIRTDASGEPDPEDLHRAWRDGARAIRLNPT